MNIFGGLEDCKGEDWTNPHGQDNKATTVQLVISLALGLSSFTAFCILRPRWKSLYAARKRQTDAASSLPELPDTFFGWVPLLYKITEQEVLSVAGLDAYVFLLFFKMAIKFLTIAFLLHAAILTPINAHFVGLPSVFDDQPGNITSVLRAGTYWTIGKGHKKDKFENDTSYLWSYFVFTYVFTALALYVIVVETKKVIRVRQDYLGSQYTVTDRTIRLSGIPPHLRTEQQISEILEKLEIGKVESITLCRDWGEIDKLMDKRAYHLRKLEGAWTVHLASKRAQRSASPSPVSEAGNSIEEEEEEETYTPENSQLVGRPNRHVISVKENRPKKRISYGFLQLRSRKVDAIDYYEEKLRRVDERIQTGRKKDYRPTALAFVTMDSIAACQMAVQALIDPTPGRLLATLAPAPSDIVWSNTYVTRSGRMVRSWTISIFVTVLSIIWLIPIAPFASLLNLCSVKKVSPELGDFLGSHEITKALVQTGLPTLVVSLLNIAVPYLYDWLSNMQGMISQSEVELSVISKNFFFTFFNVFIVFTVFGTASNIWSQIQDPDTKKLAYTLARSLDSLGLFYTNFIILQGIGLFPLRLLEFGSVSSYPFSKMAAKTPRDYAELAEPPIFKYGFYLPTSILILILCIVYTVLPAGFQVLLFGLVYFVIGYFTYKYQLLYAMDHPQHSTGRAWTMICYRLMVGLGVFQVAMAGVIALKEEFTPAALVVPLIGFTIWFSYFYGRTYEPLTRFIALRSIRQEDDPEVNIADEDIGITRPPGHMRRLSSTVDEEREKGQIFVNPSLVSPLEKIWINPASRSEEDEAPSPEITREESATSSVLLSRGIAASNIEPVDIEAEEVAAAPLTPVTTILESQNYHVTSRGEAESTRPIRHVIASSVTGGPSNRTVNICDNLVSCKDTRVKSKISPLLSEAGLASMEQATCDLVDALSADCSDEKNPNLRAKEGVVSSAWPLGVNDGSNWMDRGRTFQRSIRTINPLEKAESRKRLREATVEVDARRIKPRYYRSVDFIKDPNDACNLFEGALFEPCPHDPICNDTSEVVTKLVRIGQKGVDTPSPSAGFVRTNSNKFHDMRRVSACSKTPHLVDGKSSYLIPDLTAVATLELLPKLNHSQYSSRSSSMTGSERRLSVMSLLPAEVLCQIYISLSPADFNSARHTCRLWYIVSLDHALLEIMLKRGGWSGSIHEILASDHVLDSHVRVNDEWLMSKRVARECALGPDWTGNGLCPATESLECLYTRHDSKSTPFIQTTTTDFTEVGVHYPGLDEPTSGISFTVSNCGKFLMVAHGCLVYIYELNCQGDYGEMIKDRQNGVLRPMTSVICPRQVLACSMDTSAHRYAIAVLLDGRVGMVCDLAGLRDRTHRQSMSRYRVSQDASLSSGNEYRNRVSISSSQARCPPRQRPDQPFVFPIITAQASASNVLVDSGHNEWEDLIQLKVDPHVIHPIDQSRNTSPILFGQTEFQGHATNHFPPSSMAVEASTPTLYTPLCSADDMPRSVALCPQRRCVAFGCSSGIELHWVDALTGQDLNRWFPLTAPSDYLYFLPPRPGVDSAKKLRLISSAGRPCESSVIAERYGGIKTGTHVSPFWGVQPTGPADVAVTTWTGLGTPSRDNSDHYRAVPISDGYHLLFTDPATGLLCLGSDAPIGGPTKLLRKIWFAGPQGGGSPITYVGGSDLRWGVRVVAAYGHGPEQSIWLFSVPTDVFVESQAEQGGINLPFAGISSGTEYGNREWVRWWRTGDARNSPEPVYGASDTISTRRDRLWPVQVRGQEIGKCHGVVELAIDAGPDMTIWAFGKQGIAKTWQIQDAALDDTAGRRVLVLRDGTIRQTDASGDVQMVDTREPLTEGQQALQMPDQQTFDGSRSMTSSCVLQGKKSWGCQGNGSHNNDSWDGDGDGDVLMADLTSPDNHILDNWPVELFESVGLAPNGREILWQHDNLSSHSRVERRQVNGLDLVDVLTGIARIDIEVR